MLWFFKYFRRKILRNNRHFWLKTKLNSEKVDHNIGIQEKRHFFRRKLGKIAENVIITSTPGPTMAPSPSADAALTKSEPCNSCLVVRAAAHFGIAGYLVSCTNLQKTRASRIFVLACATGTIHWESRKAVKWWKMRKLMKSRGPGFAPHPGQPPKKIHWESPNFLMVLSLREKNNA
jgi:hypothetical protein